MQKVGGGQGKWTWYQTLAKMKASSDKELQD